MISTHRSDPPRESGWTTSYFGRQRDDERYSGISLFLSSYEVAYSAGSLYGKASANTTHLPTDKVSRAVLNIAMLRPASQKALEKTESSLSIREKLFNWLEVGDVKLYRKWLSVKEHTEPTDFVQLALDLVEDPKEVEKLTVNQMVALVALIYHHPRKLNAILDELYSKLVTSKAALTKDEVSFLTKRISDAIPRLDNLDAVSHIVFILN